MIWARHKPPESELQPPCGLDLGGREPLLRLEGSAKEAMEIGKTRLLVATVVFTVAFAVVGGRLIDLALLSEAQEPARIATESTAPIALARADILDRNGEILATTLPSASIYADPRRVIDPAGAAAQLALALPEFAPAELESKLTSARSFVWIKRNVTPREQQLVNDLGLPGIDFLREDQRVYPQGDLLSHIVGFTNIDNQGLAGIELSLNDLLLGASKPLELSIDLRVQHLFAEELHKAMVEWRGIGAAGLVMDAQTGEIVAMVSLPAYDPTDPGTAPEDARFNRATLGVYELGSIFKVFTTAMVLESGRVALGDRYDVSSPIRIGRYAIRDFKPKDRPLSVPEIFMYSSNIGTVHMVMELGTEGQQRYLDSLGLLRGTSLELPELGQPQTPRTWREINTMTISYGHGIAVTPLQVVRAMAAVINGGELPPATLIKRHPEEDVPARRVLSEETSAKMRWLTRLVVRHGTGRNANAQGYLVGGKTGTADKLNPAGGYNENARIASFLAGFPMDNPRYVVFAMVDEPKPTEYSHGYATGGWVAAPVVREVVRRMAPLLGVAPRSEEEDGGDLENALLVPAHLRGGSLAVN